MSISPVNRLPQGGVLPNGPVPPTSPVTPVSPVTPHVVLQTATINAPAGTKFTSIAIFNHGANLVGGSAAKHIPLPARRARTPKSPENEQRPRGGSPVTAAPTSPSKQTTTATGRIR